MFEPAHSVCGRYRLVEVLGSGGFGRVWRAHDEALNVEVALKEVTFARILPDEEHQELLLRAKHEARNAARLRDHPNIVGVYDVVIEHGIPWTVMQIVNGQSLEQRVRSGGPLSVEETARVADSLLNALEAAHEAGIVHRDVKPSNVMLATNGRILLADFGIAVHESDTLVTKTGVLIGSMEYMAPERTGDKRSEPPSDLFSLGATLYYACTGISLFHRDNVTATLSALLFEPLPPIPAAGRLEPLITALLAKDPTRRPSIPLARELLNRQPGSIIRAEQPPVPVPVPENIPAAAVSAVPAPTTETPETTKPFATIRRIRILAAAVTVIILSALAVVTAYHNVVWFSAFADESFGLSDGLSTAPGSCIRKRDSANPPKKAVPCSAAEAQWQIVDRMELRRPQPADDAAKSDFGLRCDRRGGVSFSYPGPDDLELWCLHRR
ncbi:serine/threonine protein kinase [Nocardia sp. NBC_01503]|uniref:serine/threonine-protein kinase n=1 Tax=Nocardia sp. NBC_01503 TaxID=2975997 RepID=UPI002E7B97B4|nr:serine/threonine-protein kinase [Nocardia sp. NBC_01503]WTL30330.1 serine/threonine protein kinase [Nocardia sp. NBC_01503]